MLLPRFLLRHASSSASNLFKGESSTLLKGVSSCQNFATTSVSRKQDGRRGGNCEDNIKIIVPKNCAERSDPILDPQCKAAIVVGGSSGFGYAAADRLLCKGAKGVIVADRDAREGELAVRKLCNAYGRDRARFVPCDLRNECSLEGAFLEGLCRFKSIQIMFNDLDKHRGYLCPRVCCESENAKWSNTVRAIHIGMKHMGKHNGGSGGIIVNCASILGFVGWPHDPEPIYCYKEAVLEDSRIAVEEYPTETTGVRVVTLCPAGREFSCIGLPELPDEKQRENSSSVSCVPPSDRRIGVALTHAMAVARTGSAWLVEPAPCLREIPRQIFFPKKGETIDPRVYDEQACPVALEPHCAKVQENACAKMPGTCEYLSKKNKK